MRDCCCLQNHCYYRWPNLHNAPLAKPPSVQINHGSHIQKPACFRKIRAPRTCNTGYSEFPGLKPSMPNWSIQNPMLARRYRCTCGYGCLQGQGPRSRCLGLREVVQPGTRDGVEALPVSGVLADFNKWHICLLVKLHFVQAALPTGRTARPVSPAITAKEFQAQKQLVPCERKQKCLCASAEAAPLWGRSMKTLQANFLARHDTCHSLSI